MSKVPRELSPLFALPQPNALSCRAKSPAQGNGLSGPPGKGMPPLSLGAPKHRG